MGKLAYSLVLSDDVMAAVDAEAARLGYSRSALVNHILAEHVNLSTPEKRAQDILTVVEDIMEQLGLRSSISTGGTLTMRTALRYKYNPQLSYIVELSDDKDILGELRVSVRTQNEQLLGYIRLFFGLWNQLEQKNLPQPPDKEMHTLEERRWLRTLRRPWGIEPQEAAEALGRYVTLMDSCIKVYFSLLDEPKRAVAATEGEYLRGMYTMGLAAQF